MSVDHHPRHVASPAWAVVCFRLSSLLLLLACLSAIIANPYSPRETVKKHVATRKTAPPRIQRENLLLLNGGNSSSTGVSKGHKAPKAKTTFASLSLVLPQFPTLQAALDQSQVVALYFGASWCKQSKPVTAMIDQTLGPKLQAYAKLPASKKRPFSLIYVSSDNTKAQFANNNRNRFWHKVPFKSAERKQLKKYFKVCAKRELEKLQIQREFEIPTLILLSGETHKVLTKNGVQELKRLGPAVLDYWTGLVRGKETEVAK